MTSLTQIVRFADDSAGLEKLLRLFQGFCTILTGLAQSVEDAESWVRLRGQFALGRRYFRLLKWHPCWSNALETISDTKKRGTLCTTLDVGKWSFLGMYFFLEALTITNALGVTTYSWGPDIQREANKCWFYALILSVLVSLYELALLQPTATPQPPPRIPSDNMDGTLDEKSANDNGSATKAKSKTHTVEIVKVQSASTTKLYTQLAIDLCDLFIPGSSVGWIPLGPVFVGTASTVSSLLAGQQIWNRVQKTSQ